MEVVREAITLVALVEAGVRAEATLSTTSVCISVAFWLTSEVRPLGLASWATIACEAKSSV